MYLDHANVKTYEPWPHIHSPVRDTIMIPDCIAEFPSYRTAHW